MNTWMTGTAAALVVAALIAVVVATVRMVRADRPRVAPGAPGDWREERLSFGLLEIR